MEATIRHSPHFAARILLLAGLLMAAGAVAAMAQPTNGRQLSDQLCARCHGIVAGDQGWTDAPSFQAIADRPDASAASLAAVIEKPHQDMLNDRRPPAEAEAIAAYIMTLRAK